jgi:hypothetical protein
MSSTRTALTPADLLNLPRPNDGQHDELSDGELIVVSSAGARHELVKSRYMWALSACQLRYSTGGVFAESQFTPGEATARIPDVAFVQDAKLKLLPDADVPIPFGPDWQVYPRERRVRVRTAAGIRELVSADVLTTPVMPGFEVPVQSFFTSETPA